jgi:4-carboxymuconolactone decarboxylase
MTAHQSRAEAGRAMIEQLGPGIADAVRSTTDMSAELGRLLEEYAFGDVYLSGDLDLRTRELITIAALVGAGGTPAPVRNHIAAATAVGVTHEEIMQLFVQLVPVVGFARVLTAAWDYTASRTPA